MNSYLQKAKDLLSSVSKRELPLAEIKEQAISLASLLFLASQQEQTSTEKKQQMLLASLMADYNSKNLITEITDQCFRSENAVRVADQMRYLLQKRGLPKNLPMLPSLELKAFSMFSRALPAFLVPFAKQAIRKQMASVIISGDSLDKYLEQRTSQGFKINLNHLGEAILGEEEAEKRLEIYLNDLKHPQIDYISVKISSIFSQINLIDWQTSLDLLAARLRRLYRAAKNHSPKKCVNLDMEEYRDLYLTTALFKKVLDEEEFFTYTAGIALQSYIPDSFLIQKELTEWAQERTRRGGAPIRIRLVKGANLAMEKVESSMKGWPQAPYHHKWEADANFKRMLFYGCESQRTSAVHLGVGSHNLFDIALALLLRECKNLNEYITFEMLEGMAPHMSRVVKEISQDLLLYSPIAEEKDFQTAVAYLIRRLDENTTPENFLHDLFSMQVENPTWKKQVEEFLLSCDEIENISSNSRPTIQRNREESTHSIEEPFQNCPDTDWTQPTNRTWISEKLEKWKNHEQFSIPLQIGGQEVETIHKAWGVDPSQPDYRFYAYQLASKEQIDQALSFAKKGWEGSTLQYRSFILAKAADEFRKARGELICTMVADAGKTVSEADAEVSEAVDFCEYYRRNAEEMQLLNDITWNPLGAIAVISPWNFPCSIPVGGIAASLISGNSVIFKPPQESVLVGWEIAKVFWRAGVPKNILQFITAADEDGGTALIQHPDLHTAILTGSTITAKYLLKLNPSLRLCAETGGKNSMIVTEIADRDLAIRDIIQSAFGHAGQKCSACSLLILLPEIYEDSNFKAHLKDAAASLAVGSAWDMKTKITPLIRSPEEILLKGLTVLESHEEWLLQPTLVPGTTQLWTPGIKWGVTKNSFSYHQELFGPILSVMKANNLEHALKLANGTMYGLTAGIHSLDPREVEYWRDHIQAGNLYVNRGITGAIVLRQPFGGTKLSSFGPGAKAGGPNYVQQFMNPQQTSLPNEIDPIPEDLQPLDRFVENLHLDQIQLARWKASLGSYSYFQNRYFNLDHDYAKILGQDNLHYYVPRQSYVVRVSKEDSLLDVLLVCAAALIAKCPAKVSLPKTIVNLALPPIEFIEEDDPTFAKKIAEQKTHSVRFLSRPTDELKKQLASSDTAIIIAPVLANGRLELLNYLREVSLSNDYHRYGYLGERLHDHEIRVPKNGICCGANRPCCGDNFCDETG